MNRLDTDTAHRLWNSWIEKSSHKAELLNPCDLIRMVEDELEKRNHRHVVVKDLFLANGTTPDKVWIGEANGGEGGDFDKDDFYEVLRGFYDTWF